MKRTTQTQFPTNLVLITCLFMLAPLMQSCATLIGQNVSGPDALDGAYNDAAPDLQSPSPPVEDQTADPAIAAPRAMMDQDPGRSPAQTDFHIRIDQAIRRRDILVGMSEQDVLASWGQPRDVQVAGDPSFGNERWDYYTSNSLLYGIGDVRTLYFEQGKVVGWQTSSASNSAADNGM